MFRSILTATVALSAALAIGAPASAAGLAVFGDGERNVVTVKYTETDLHTVRGAKALAVRVRVAAEDVCGASDPVVRQGDQFYACREAAIDRAMAQVSAPLVAEALHVSTRLSAQASR